MQHHTHAPRPAHMRAHHIHQQQTALPPPQTMHPTVAPTPHITMNLGPPPTASQQSNASNTAATSHQHHQHQQQTPLSHHINNGSTLTLPIATNTQPQQQQQQQQQQSGKSNYIQPSVHNRLNQHHPQPHQLMHAQPQQIQRINQQTIHSTAQMQKIRQQHQLVNNSNKVNSLPHQTQNQQQLMGIQQPHQRNLHHPSHHVAHIKQQHQQHHHMPQQNLQQQQHHAANVQPVNISKQPLPQQQHVMSASPASGVPQTHNMPQTQSQDQQQQQQGYSSGGVVIKTKYNNAPTITASVASVPKTILQNPNRASKIKQQNVIPITPELSSSSVVGKMPQKNSIISEDTATSAAPVVSAKSHAAAGTTMNMALSENLNCTSTIPEVCAKSESSSQVNKENTKPSTSSCDELLSDNILTCDDANSGNGSKEKTPMCLVNELARFNKITHQYRLTNEKGPAHCKRFTVTLKLGDEEYSAEGYKIKKAQHLAAAEAIEKTNYKHPVPKIIRRSDEGSSRATITPTVELNALAMKLGQQTYYLFDPRQQPPSDTLLQPSPDIIYGGGGMPPQAPPPSSHAGPQMMPTPPPHHMLDAVNLYMRRNTGAYVPPNQRYPHQRGYPPHPSKFISHHRYPLMPPVMSHNGNGGMPPHLSHGPYASYATPCKITLIVGKQKFVGIGRTLQSAKHDAASRALQVLKTQAANKLNEILNRSIEESDNKSPISLVHEIGIKRNMTVNFKVLREEGPAHMKNFITACVVGNIVTEGEGNGKKISKKHAADKMLEELKKLPPLSPTKSPVKKIKVKAPAKAGLTGQNTPGGTSTKGGAERKKRSGGASIKEKNETDNTDSDNPISKLIVLLQSRKEKEPVYELISKNGNENTRRREFIIEVSAAGSVARGTGNNKKLAKKNAAQNLLEALCLKNVAASGQVAANEIIEDKQQNMDRSETNNEEAGIGTNQAQTASTEQLEPLDIPLVKTTAGQVPGILILRQNKKSSAAKNAKIGTSASATALKPSSMDIITSSVPAPTQTTVLATSASTIASASISQSAAEVPVHNSKVSDDIQQKAESSTPTNTSSSISSSTGLHMKNQLLYLAQLLGFEVNFSDYPKGNHSEFLTIVTLSTTPAQICHGTGANAEESQNDAAKNALKILSKLGLNNVKSN